MLIAMLTVFLFGSSGQSVFAYLDKLANRIAGTVKADKRVAQLEHVVGGMKDAAKDYQEKSAEAATKLANAVQDPKSNRGTFEGVLAQSDRARASYWTRELASRTQLRELLTRAEWKELFGTPEKPKVFVAN